MTRADRLLGRFLRAFDLYANSDGRNAASAYDELAEVAVDTERYFGELPIRP